MERFRSITISICFSLILFALPAAAQTSGDVILQEVLKASRNGNMDGCRDLGKRVAALPEAERKKFLAGIAKELDASPRDIRHGWWLLSAVRDLGPQSVSLAPNVVPFLFDGANTGAVSALKAMGPGSVPALCKALENDSDGHTTVYVAETLEAFPAPAEQPLLKLVGGKNALAAKNATWVLAHLPKVSARSATGLAAKLGDPKLSGDAMEALVKAGAPAVPDILEVLSSSDEQVRSRALEVLHKIGKPAKLAVPKVTGFLNSKDQQVQFQAAGTLLRIAPDNAPELAQARAWLLKMLQDPNSGVRFQAAMALGESGPAAAFAVPALTAAMKAQHPPAVNSFESIGMSSQVQGAAWNALVKIHDKRSVPDFVKALSDPSKSSERYELIETLTTIGPAASASLPILRKIVFDPNAVYRDKALEAVNIIDTDSARKRDDARKLIKDERLRTQAMAMLAKYPAASNDRNTIDEFLAALKDSNMQTKWNAIEALGNAGPAASAAIPILLKENLGSSYMPDQRSRAFKAIKQIDPTGEKTIPLIRKSLDDCFEVQSAVELLEYIHSPQALAIAQTTRAKWKLK